MEFFVFPVALGVSIEKERSAIFYIFNPLIRVLRWGVCIQRYMEEDSESWKIEKTLSSREELGRDWHTQSASPDVETIALLITIMIKILFYIFSFLCSSTFHKPKSLKYANLFVLK